MNAQVDVRYATSSDGAAIAFQTVGSGPDLLYACGIMTQLSAFVQFPVYFYSHYIERLASFSRLIMFDHRGSGLSDPLPADGELSLDQQADDVLSVLDAAGAHHAALLAELNAGPAVIRFAARHPERVRSLVLNMTYARLTRSDDYPHGQTNDATDLFVASIVEAWGTGAVFSSWQPEIAEDPRMLRQLAEFERLAASPARARALFELWRRNDARADLSRLDGIRTLVLHDRDNLVVPAGHGRYLAEHIPGTKYHEYPGASELSTIESVREQTELISEWVTGSRVRANADRLVGALVFVDVVDSTSRIAGTSDLEWRSDVEAFRRAADDELERVGARLVNTRGDDVFAFCRTVGSAISVARALRARARGLGMETRAGIHLAEVDDVGDDILGLGVHVAARVAALASAGEILLTETARTAVLGGPDRFGDGRSHELTGIPGEWRLVSLVDRPDR